MADDSSSSDSTVSKLLGGYTGYCTIDGKPVLMTSYSISVSTNVIKSQAAMPFFGPRMAGYALRDYPVYSLSVTIEPHADIFDYLMKSLFHSTSNNSTSAYCQGFSVSLVINDNVYSLTHTFSVAYVNGLECDVPNEGACTINLSFVYFGSSWETKFSARTIKQYNIYEDSPAPSSIRTGWDKLVGASLMAYYFFGVKYSGYPYYNLYEFSFSFSQDITPKFFCYGAESSQGNAPYPKAVVWGLPTLTYNLTYVMALSDVSVNDYTRVKSHKIVVGKNDGTDATEAVSLSIWYQGKQRITFGTCYPDSYSPSLVYKGAEAERYSITGTVYGHVRYSDGTDTSSGG